MFAAAAPAGARRFELGVTVRASPSPVLPAIPVNRNRDARACRVGGRGVGLRRDAPFGRTVQTLASFAANSGRPFSPRKPATRPFTAAAKLRVDPTARNSPVLKKETNTVQANQCG